MGQLRSKACPVCRKDNGGKWTCSECTALVNLHRELIRNLQSWHSLFEALEVSDVIVGSDGNSYCLWDVDRLYEARTRLPYRMAQAIELCLYQNVLEREAALKMGVAPTNPVAVYATVGLTRLLSMAHDGSLPGYQIYVGEAA